MGGRAVQCVEAGSQHQVSSLATLHLVFLEEGFLTEPGAQ